MGCSCCRGNSFDFNKSLEFPRFDFAKSNRFDNRVNRIGNVDCCRERAELNFRCCNQRGIDFNFARPNLSKDLLCCDVIKKGERNTNFLNGLLSLNSKYGDIAYGTNVSNYYSIF